MNKKMVEIIMYALSRNALQILVGVCIGVYICAKNPTLDTECSVLFTTLAPFFALVGGPLTVVLSVFNSLGLWQEAPPEK
jgi:hypothetical protein